MRKSLISIFSGIIIISAMILNADAHMCDYMGKPGGGMTGGMMEGAEHGGFWTMHGGSGVHPFWMMRFDDHHRIWKYLMSLGLDEKQTEALKALRSKTMKEMIKKMADMQIAGMEFKDLVDKDPVDMKAVEASAKKCEALRTEMLLTRIRALEEVKSILTPEQRKRFREMMESEHGAGCGMKGGAEQMDMQMHEHMH